MFFIQATIKHKYTGEQITFLQTTDDTNNEFLYIEVALPPLGKGPPLHMHDAFEEHFEVIEGKLTIRAEKEIVELKKGDTLTASIGMKHTFYNAQNEPVVFRVKLSPGMFFEQSARIHYGLMEDGLTNEKGNPKKLAHTALILSMQNTLVVGLPIYLQRILFKLIVKRAYRKGEYEGFEQYTGIPMKSILERLYQ